MEILVHDALERGGLGLEPKHPQRVAKRIRRDHRKILVAPHQRTQPGIFELLDAPDLGDDLAVTGKRLLGHGGHRLNIVKRAIGIEHDGFDAHLLGGPLLDDYLLDGSLACPVAPIVASRNSLTASIARSVAAWLNSR